MQLLGQNYEILVLSELPPSKSLTIITKKPTAPSSPEKAVGFSLY